MYIVFSGSLRSGSLNRKLIQVVHRQIASSQLIELKDLNIPVYDGDVEAQGMPEGVNTLAKLIQEAKGVIIASPEYNGSIAGSLKNTIDWLSRFDKNIFNQKKILLMGATPGGFGTIRAMQVTQLTLSNLGAQVYPETFPLSRAHEQFDENNQLKDEVTFGKLEKLLNKYMKWVHVIE